MRPIMCGDRDVTEAVQVLYDLVIGSLDWGSGFFSVEDVVPILELAEVCDFGERDKIEDYIVSDAVNKRHSLWVAEQGLQGYYKSTAGAERDEARQRIADARERIRAEERAGLRKGRMTAAR